ncbi:MAG TPA: phosphotransferase [Candidatus Saccharimonadales bacterium]|nr:phosphotransferase [Candidatus Saccharimonadales bacterium]
MAEQNFEHWLHQRHQTMQTPADVIKAYVKKATGAEPAQLTRHIVGMMNEVHKAELPDGSRVIVRISHWDDPRFVAEKWALEAAASHGVPTPKVLLVEDTKVDGKNRGFCIEEDVPGTSLEHLIEAGDEAQAKAVIPKIGEVLGRIHATPIQGFGYLQPDGRGWDIPFSHIMLDLLDHKKDLARAADYWNLSHKQVQHGLALLETHQDYYTWDTPVLVHGDFNPAHILVKDGEITGIIDFQECSGNHPVLDFARWEMYWGSRIPIRDVMASYTNQALFDDRYEALFHLVTIRMALWMYTVQADRQTADRINKVSEALDKSLAFFKV